MFFKQLFLYNKITQGNIDQFQKEAIDNVTPSDRFFGRDKEILKQRKRIKAETMCRRRKIYRLFIMNNLIGSSNQEQNEEAKSSLKGVSESFDDI